MTNVTQNRPLSPHLSIYKQIPTMVMSIVHRFTGVALYGGTMLVVVAGGRRFGCRPISRRWTSSVRSSVGSCCSAFTWALLHHMLGGIRHFIWDTGRPATNGQVDHQYDVVVVGAGGAGLRATLGMAEQGLRTACITKVFPTRSHTVAAQGGIAASLGNMGRTTGSGTCTTRSRARTGSATGRDGIPGREAPKAVYELEHYGVPFSRTEDGKIYQRPFGGHMQNFGRRPAGAAHLCRGGPDRPRHPAHAVWPVAEAQCASSSSSISPST
jgi:succinate dehydrogenase cytochrome b556 subunit